MGEEGWLHVKIGVAVKGEPVGKPPLKSNCLRIERGFRPTMDGRF